MQGRITGHSADHTPTQYTLSAATKKGEPPHSPQVNTEGEKMRAKRQQLTSASYPGFSLETTAKKNLDCPAELAPTSRRKGVQPPQDSTVFSKTPSKLFFHFPKRTAEEVPEFGTAKTARRGEDTTRGNRRATKNSASTAE